MVVPSTSQVELLHPEWPEWPLSVVVLVSLRRLVGMLTSSAGLAPPEATVVATSTSREVLPQVQAVVE
jgi:hypothetical protein